VPKLLGKKKYEWHVKFQRPFSEIIRKKVYAKVFTEIKKCLKEGKNVVVEGTFYTENFRQGLRDVAKSCNAKLYFVEVVCPEDIVKEKMINRLKKESTPARFGIHKNIKKLWEPIKEEHTMIDSSKDVDNQISTFLKSLDKETL
jgi:predicted kinase